MLNLEEKENVSTAKKNTVAGKLLSIESIFKWKPIIYDENLQEITCEFEPQSRNQFNFYNFVIRLVKCYKNCDDTKSNDESALKILDELILAPNEFNEDGDGGYFRKIENAYFHMVYASKTFLLIRNDKHEEAADIIEKINPFDEMDDCNKAAIHGMKSAVFVLFSTEDCQKAFASIDKALKLDERGQWYFLKGLYIRRIRRMTNPFESPSLQEKEQFEKAFEKEPSNVVFKLHLADVYREITKHASQRSDLCSHFLPKDNTLNDILKSNIDEKFHLAAQYYKEAAKEFPDCPYVMFRAADGLAKLPEGLTDIKMARKLTKDGLKLSPENVCGNLVQAFICEKLDKNMKDARKHLKICTEKSIFDADMNMIRILHSTKPNELKGIEVLKVLMEKYKEKARHAILYSQMVSYYLFVKYDLVEANKNATHFYELNTGSTCMKFHRSCFVVTAEPFSLIYVLIDEVKYVMDGHRNLEALENSCKQFLHFINFQNITPLPGFPQNFRQQILDGKPMTINEKCLQKPFKKFDQKNKGLHKRENTNKRGNFGKERVLQSNANSDNNRNNQMPRRKPNEIDQVPSLMDIKIPKPVDKNVQKQSENTPTENVVKKHVEKRSEENDESSSDDSKMAEIIKKLVKQMKKKKSQPEGKSKSKNEDEESIVELLKFMALGSEKSTRSKKHRSDSDSETDSDYKRRKDRRRDRSRRRHRSLSDSDDSERYSRRHRRHKHHSSDSENSSRSVKRKSHKKDRHERDYSPRSRHHRRRHHSSDDDVDYKSTYRRDDSGSPERRRRHRRDSRDRSHSYEKRRRSSPKKYKSSRRRSTSPDEPRRGRENSVASRDCRDKSPSYDKHSRRRSPKKERSDHRERKISSEREEIDKTSHEKKSRRRSSSRDKPQSRGNKNTKSKKDGESSKNTSKRDQNSSRRSGEESDS